MPTRHARFRRPLRAVVGVTALALLVSLAGSPPATADSGGNVTVLSGPTNPDNPAAGVVTVLETPLGAISIANPGGVEPVDQQCVPLPDGAHTSCVGSSGQLNLAGGSPNAHLAIQSNDLYGDRTREALGWIIDEAHVAVAAIHGVANDGLVDSYARPEVRTYVALRLQLIMERKLYGQPLTDQEQQTYEWLMRQFNARETARARDTWAEYQRWESDPCGYPVPAPPAGSGMPDVPNPVARSVNCYDPNAPTQLFKFTKGTPPVDTFEAWASYRHPTPSMRLAGDPRYQQMTYNTTIASSLFGGLGAALAAGAGVGLAVASSTTLAAAVTAATSVAYWIPVQAATETALAGAGFGFDAGAVGGAVAGATAGAAAGAVASIVFALVAIGVSAWMLAQEASTAATIKQRAEAAGANDDPLGIVSDQGRYAGLNLSTLQNPATGDPTVIHRQDFSGQLMGMVQEWLSFDAQGQLVPDPTTPFDPGAPPALPAAAQRTVTQRTAAQAAAGPTVDAFAHFTSGGASVDSVAVKAPDGSVDVDGNPVTGYQVWLSHGWLMVSDFVNGAYQPARPKPFVNFLDAAGQPATMSIVRHTAAGGQVSDGFEIVHAPAGQPLDTRLLSQWTFQGPGGALRAAGIAIGNPLLPSISLLPSATADAFYPGHRVTFQSNVSAPGQGANGRYSWAIDHLGSDGQVLDSTTHSAAENLSGFQQRFDQPGSYRATVRFAGSQGTQPFDVSGSVGFTVATPQPSVVTATLRDAQVLAGKLSLNLRVTEPVATDTLDVAVHWADDGTGQLVTKDYTVHCRSLGDGTCDTDPLVGPDDGPTNPNWSEPPTYLIPDDQAFLPQVTATVTNGFGQSTTQVLQAPGESRPRYADRNPYVQMVAGTFSRVRVTEITPTALAGNPVITILPFVDAIDAALPAGVAADVEQDGGHWYIDLMGSPRADDMGPHTFYFPVEQEPVGMGLRPPPALVTLDIVPSTSPGYRAVLRNTPATFAERQYRTAYPDYVVQVTQTLGAGDTFAPFTGTVMCRLSASGTVLLEQPCQADAEFPWPTALSDDSYTAEVWVQSSTQPVVPDHYGVTLSTVFLTPHLTVDSPAAGALDATVSLVVNDHKYAASGPVGPPFSAHGYVVTCSVDGGPYAACLDGGTMNVLRTPGAHSVATRVVAPDGATSTSSVSWTVATPPTRLVVLAPTHRYRAGTRLLVQATGLLPRETYTIRIDGRLVASGGADDTGSVSRFVVIPRTTPTGTRALVVTGATALRRGTTTLHIV